ncbi:hypothetical protein NE237_028468 [Protea cynaroides]|uniref:Uncharacterized protein n=1 Tax=Protea cynaroides TaxID=273540 RepID=A0A9Q0GPF6_9MAGN|nr:hypothetical protein NE237_028468 [Protea cynaroides]
MVVLLLRNGGETTVGKGAGAEVGCTALVIQLLKLRNISFSSGESLKIGGSYNDGLVRRIMNILIKPSRVRNVPWILHPKGKGFDDNGEGLVGVTQRTHVIPNASEFLVMVVLGDVTSSGFDAIAADITGDVSSTVVEAVND